MSQTPLQVRQVMTSPVVTVAPTMPVAEAAELLHRQRVFALPVVRDGALVGMVDEPSLLWAAAALRDAASPTAPSEDGTIPQLVGDVMRRPVRWVKPRDPAHLAAQVLRRGERVLPVVERGRVVGIVSRSDLLPLLSRLARLARQPGQDRMTTRPPAVAAFR